MYTRRTRAAKRYNPYFNPNESPVKIFWAPEFNSYALKTPKLGGEEAQNFLFDIRMVDNARWEPTHNVWLVPETAFEEISLIAQAYFPGFKADVTPKPDSTAEISNINVTDAASAALKMFQVGGYDNAKKVYSTLIKQYHPDLNPSPEAKTKAAEITTAWRTLKNSLGWN